MSLFERAGAPPEALLPLMRRTIENGFELTGPISRGDWTTMDAHLAAIGEHRPELETLYRALGGATTARGSARSGTRSRRSGPSPASVSCRRWALSTPATSR